MKNIRRAVVAILLFSTLHIESFWKELITKAEPCFAQTLDYAKENKHLVVAWSMVGALSLFCCKLLITNKRLKQENYGLFTALYSHYEHILGVLNKPSSSYSHENSEGQKELLNQYLSKKGSTSAKHRSQSY